MTIRSAFTAAILLGFAPFAKPMLAASEARDCPAEPTQNVLITSGYVFAGPACVLSPAADLDSFRFTASAGDLYRLAVAMNGALYPNNICLDVYDPASTRVFSQCSDSYHGQLSVLKDLTVTTSGTHTMVITEQGNDASIQYGVSLEKLHPTPPEASQFTLGAPVTDEINPLTDMDAFKFTGYTVNTYRITASIASGGYPSNLCFAVFAPDGSSPGTLCTDSYHGANSIQMDLVPAQDGTQVVLMEESSFAKTVGYNLNIVCLSGANCAGPQTCTLKDVLGYDAATGTLTMNFTVGSTYAATWNAWLTYQNSVEALFSTAQPVTDPPVNVIKTRTGLGKSGRVGVLSTLTTPKRGIACSNWVQISTGTP
ncbi:MAG: hypothetical protein U0Q18_36240 [Bryobacteraceae bacterium]